MRPFLLAGAVGLLLAAATAVVMGYAPVGSEPSAATHAPAEDTGLNVIFVTWDGIRADEFLGHADPELAPGDRAPLLPYFWGVLAPKGRVYGDRRAGQVMTVANSALMSLPAYESMFAGSTQPCQGNECGQVGRVTFPERLAADLGLQRRQVATFASWDGLTFAVESHPGRTHVDAGLRSPQQAGRPPWPDARFDKDTWRQALHYLETERPRFLYVSLNDADEWGHRRDYANYVKTIRQYDQWLRQLVGRLAALDDYGRNTCLIVTTDHGRGLKEHWTAHSNGQPYSGFVLMYAGCPLAPERVAFKAPSRLTTHLDIRPTVEQLFGLEPYSCLLCGASLVETVAADRRRMAVR